MGTFRETVVSEPTVPEKRWVEKYGPVVRNVGPMGFERVCFMKPEALHRILVSEWTENPRVRSFGIVA